VRIAFDVVAQVENGVAVSELVSDGVVGERVGQQVIILRA
jgi:hypothetical protein